MVLNVDFEALRRFSMPLKTSVEFHNLWITVGKSGFEKKVLTLEKDNWGVIEDPYGVLKIHELKSPTSGPYNKKIKNQFFITVQ